jgi:hypothetical protein
MKNHLRFLFFFLAIVLISLGGCRKPAGTQQNTNRATPAPQEPAAGSVATSGEKFYFRGTIGSNLKIEMTLLRDGERVTGTYFYPKVGKNIDLKGAIDKSGNLDLRESDETGKESGVFKGKWNAPSKPTELGMSNISGKWSKPDGSKETSFQLTQEPSEFSVAHFVLKVIKETNKQRHYSVDVEYPQVEGDARFDKFNKESRAMIMKDIAAFKSAATATENDYGTEVPDEATNSYLDSSYEIRFATDELISIQFSSSDYSRGAAHPNSYTNVLNYDVKNGKKLTLADLFNAKSNYLKTISDYCIKDLKDQSKKNTDLILDDEQIKSGASARADNFKSWTITKTGLAIVFDPYQVGPYAAGPQNVLVPYSALKDLIKSDGPVGSFAK